MKRTHMCGEVSKDNLNQLVTVTGWVHKRRNLGQLIFLSIRDRSGLVQAVVHHDHELFEIANNIRSEYVIGVTGTVISRTPENINTEMKTGEIEIAICELIVYSEAITPPFQLLDTGVKEDLRLKHRYLDLRRPMLQNNLLLRHQTMQVIRQFLNENNFLEIETPILTKSTPEGARDYLVPSRVNPRSFYALPQSPQIFKQLLMVSGLDRYYQIAKCFRDEDLRADRQPEFTQVDMELSFVDVDDIIKLNEHLMQRVFKEVLGIDITIPFIRLTYFEAMRRFGSDKPDMRFGMELCDLTDTLKNSSFETFRNAIDLGGSVRAICVPTSKFSRRQLDSLTELAKTYRAKNLFNIVVSAEGSSKTSLTKFLDENTIDEIIKQMNCESDSLILICADENNKIVFDALGALRIHIAKLLNMIDDENYKFLWVTEFPLLEWSDGRYFAMHHPFTMPMDEDIPLLETSPQNVRAKAYDIILNGCEVGGGSLRIYNSELQTKMFELLNLSEYDIHERFGFLLEAFKYGTPPHGGIAYGLDRLIMLLTGTDNIRDVIAFPKTQDAACVLTSAPSSVDSSQLNDLGIKI